MLCCCCCCCRYLFYINELCEYFAILFVMWQAMDTMVFVRIKQKILNWMECNFSCSICSVYQMRVYGFFLLYKICSLTNIIICYWKRMNNEKHVLFCCFTSTIFFCFSNFDDLEITNSFFLCSSSSVHFWIACSIHFFLVLILFLSFGVDSESRYLLLALNSFTDQQQHWPFCNICLYQTKKISLLEFSVAD